MKQSTNNVGIFFDLEEHIRMGPILMVTLPPDTRILASAQDASHACTVYKIEHPSLLACPPGQGMASYIVKDGKWVVNK